MANPLAKYSPLMIEAWRKACLEPVHLPVETKAEATSLRHRLYKCRVDIRATRHEIADMTERVTISIEERSGLDGPLWYVVMNPAEANYDATFKAAGITMPDAPDLE